MKTLHYKVVIGYINYREPYPESGTKREIVYKTWEEILQKFPTLGETAEPSRGENNTFLFGDNYHGIFLSHVQLTYDKISKKRPTEEELRRHYASHSIDYWLDHIGNC